MICELCEREVQRITKHHLLPKSKGGKNTETVNLCQPCHSTIHHTFSNKELARNFTSLAALKSAGALQKYLEWIKTKQIERLNF
jgi:hypothetical protein